MGDLNAEVLQRLDRIESLLIKNAKPEEWISKQEAMNLLGYGRSTLEALVAAGKIKVNSNPRKGKRLKYSRTSISKYNANPDL